LPGNGRIGIDMQSKRLIALKSAARGLITLFGPTVIEFLASLEKNSSPWVHALALGSGIATKFLVTYFSAKDVQVGTT